MRDATLSSKIDFDAKSISPRSISRSRDSRSMTHASVSLRSRATSCVAADRSTSPSASTRPRWARHRPTISIRVSYPAPGRGRGARRPQRTRAPRLPRPRRVRRSCDQQDEVLADRARSLRHSPHRQALTRPRLCSGGRVKRRPLSLPASPALMSLNSFPSAAARKNRCRSVSIDYSRSIVEGAMTQ